jgi:uncharacterized membrane protein YqjE
MSEPGRSWGALVREIGEAFLALLRAEVEAVARDLGDSGRSLLRALLVAALAGAVAFWALGLVVYLAVELVALALPRWGAVGVVFAVFACAAALLGWLAAKRLGAIEPPAATVRRRMEDSRRWWQERIAGEPGASAPPRRGPAEEEEDLP